MEMLGGKIYIRFYSELNYQVLPFLQGSTQHLKIVCSVIHKIQISMSSKQGVG